MYEVKYSFSVNDGEVVEFSEHFDAPDFQTALSWGNAALSDFLRIISISEVEDD